MVRRRDDQAVAVNENMRGGNGAITIITIASKDEMYEKGRLFAHLVIKKDCSIGWHIHEDEMEAFYILKGKAWYNDNGTETELLPGDTAYTPSGYGHCIGNNEDEDMELIAMILYR